MEKQPYSSPLTFSQRSGTMTIDTTLAQNTFASQRHKSSHLETQQQLRRRSVYSSEPIMSPEELTSKIADNFQQFSSMLNQLQNSSPHSPARSRPTTPILNRLSRPNSIDNKQTRRFSLMDDDTNNKPLLLSPVSMVSPLHGPTKHTIPKKKNTMVAQDKPLVTKFLRAACNGDTGTVEALARQCGELVFDTDADDRTTALIYAACFGHSSTVQSLLNIGAPIDEQDHYGWTALMWATANRHESVVALLLSWGAMQDTRSMYGTMVFDLISDNHSLTATLLDPTCSRRHYSTMDRKEKRKKNRQLLKSSRRQSTPVIAATTTNHCQSPTGFRHSGGVDAYTHFMTTESAHHRRLTQRHELFYDALLTLKNGDDAWTDMGDMDANDNDGVDDDMQILESDKSTNRPFSWDSCLVDQMFVFSMDDLDAILDVTLDTKSMPRTNNNMDDSLWLPANMLFLCARFTCYYSNRAALTQFLDITISRLAKTSKQSAKDTSMLLYWMTNIFQLLVYIGRDTGLERNTAQHRRQLADLLTELYVLLIRGYEKQLDKLITSQLLDYESITRTVLIDFEDSNDWSSFFQRRGSIRASIDSLGAGGGATVDADKNESVGPHAMTATLERIHIMMTTMYELPEYMVKHAMAQCLHYILCEGFQQILETRTYLCRSKAQNIRLNLSILEEWARQMDLENTYCMAGLDRLAQLLQLLKCMTELDDVDAFQDVCRGLTLLDSADIRQCVVKYRYETQEAHLPTCVEDWVVQQAQQHKPKQSTLDQNIYMHQLKGILLGYSSEYGHDDRKQNMVDGPCIVSQSMDSQWILPFSQEINSGPSSSSMVTQNVNTSWKQQGVLSEHMYLNVKQKVERDKKLSIRIPSLPYKFIDILDKKLNK